MSPTSPTPCTPLGTTAEAFVQARRGRIFVLHTGQRLGGGLGALRAYQAFHRTADLSATGGTEPEFPVVQILRDQAQEGEVVKFLTRVPGTTPQAESLTIESVLIPMIGSRGQRTYTLCVSSQVGCAMGCTFCETAQMGLLRSLTPEEIVVQWWNARHRIPDEHGVTSTYPVTNIVFMGMGEPLDNYDNVIAAIDILRDHNGPHLSVHKITVSTVGRVDGIRKLMEQIKEPGWRRLGLALSLNAPNDADRSAIMPINRKYSLGDVQRALLDWPRAGGSKVCIEYVLIPGVNDTQTHADQIAAFITPLGLCETGKIGGNDLLAVLNLIPYNPRRDSPWPAPSEAQVEEFMRWLIDRKVFVKRRRTKGRNMMGACGQLGSEHIRKRRVVTPTVSVGGGLCGAILDR